MDIYIVTPSYNSSETINRTIASVIFQSGNFNIYYHIQDGGSNDETVSLLEKWQENINKNLIPISCNKVIFSYSSEPDNGMYHAIQKGFSKLNFKCDDWITWINSDDIILPGSCSLICNIHKDPDLRKKVNWVTGQPMILNNGSIVKCLERMLNSDTIKSGLADGVSAPFIQQEGTFFRGFLWEKYNEEALSKFSYAGDWSLWKHFASEENPYYADIPLGVFTSRPDQLSKKFWHKYMLEIISNNDYSGKKNYSDKYYRIVARLHDGALNAEERITNVNIKDDKKEMLYKNIKKCLELTEINLALACARLFIFGYNGFSRHIFSILKNNQNNPDAFIVSEEKFTNSNDERVMTITEASLSEHDIIIVTSFNNANFESILTPYNVKPIIIYWTELLPEEV